MIINTINTINTINNFAQVGLPSSAVDRVVAFVETIWTNLVGVLILAFLELVWTLFLEIFIELAPAWGLALVIFAWSYFFYRKFVEPTG